MEITIKKPTNCFSFEEREPKLNDRIKLIWEDGSTVVCYYDGFIENYSILPKYWKHYSIEDEVIELDKNNTIFSQTMLLALFGFGLIILLQLILCK